MMDEIIKKEAKCKSYKDKEIDAYFDGFNEGVRRTKEGILSIIREYK